MVDGPTATRSAHDGTVPIQLRGGVGRELRAGQSPGKSNGPYRSVADHESDVCPEETEDCIQKAISSSQGSGCAVGGAVPDRHVSIPGHELDSPDSTPGWEPFAESQTLAHSGDRGKTPKLGGSAFVAIGILVTDGIAMDPTVATPARARLIPRLGNSYRSDGPRGSASIARSLSSAAARIRTLITCHSSGPKLRAFQACVARSVSPTTR